MRKFMRLILFNACLLGLLLGVVWLAQRAPDLPVAASPTGTLPAVQTGVTDPISLPTGDAQPPAPAPQAAAGTPALTPTTLPAQPPAAIATPTPQSEPVSDPGDPLYNDAPEVMPALALPDDPANVRHAHLTFEFVFDNHGPGDVLDLDVYVAMPESRANQRINGLTFSAPYTPTTDEYGQSLAHFRFAELKPGERATIGWQGDVEIEARSYGIDPAQVTALDTIPQDIVDTYVNRPLDRYGLDSRTIQNAARLAAAGATNPYWIARNVHDYVARRLSYDNDGEWADAQTIFLQRRGSCTEYALLYISLLRANGVPARYVAGTRQRQEGRYVDTLFHRWNEIYLPPYGWVPVDVLHDDRTGGPHSDYFGAISDERFVTTVGGGGSAYLGWNYHYGYRYDYDGERPDVSRERRFVWEPYPQELRVSHATLSGAAIPGGAEILLGTLGVVTTNGATGWSATAGATWLRLEPDAGTTPATVRVLADPAALKQGLYAATVIVHTPSPDRSVTIPVELRVGTE